MIILARTLFIYLFLVGGCVIKLAQKMLSAVQKIEAMSIFLIFSLHAAKLSLSCSSMGFLKILQLFIIFNQQIKD